MKCSVRCMLFAFPKKYSTDFFCKFVHLEVSALRRYRGDMAFFLGFLFCITLAYGALVEEDVQALFDDGESDSLSLLQMLGLAWLFGLGEVSSNSMQPTTNAQK